MNYKEMLILAYFKNNYKKYNLAEIMQMMGMTYSYFTQVMESLFEKEQLLIIKGYIVLSKKAEILLNEKKFASFKFEEFKGQEITRLDINEPYIPIDFKL